MRTRKFVPWLLVLSAVHAFSADRPKITLDEFFDYVSFSAVELSPDGRSVVIATERPDWQQNIFRRQLWLYRDDGPGGSLRPLTQSGHESAPRWSPDGRWIAFLSGREAPKGNDSCDSSDEINQLYLISPRGGEAFPVTRGAEEVHSFAWSADSRTLYFARPAARTEEQKKAYAEKWKDVCRYRDAERGDSVFSVSIESALRRQSPLLSERSAGDDDSPAIGASLWRMSELAASPDGKRLAFVTTSISERMEKFTEFEIYSFDLTTDTANHPPRQLTHNEAMEENLHWDRDSKRLFFQIEYGSAEGKYKDHQTRLYSVDPESAAVQRVAGDFEGQITQYSVPAAGGVMFAGRLGTQVPLYTQPAAAEKFARLEGWQGTYERVGSAAASSRIAFVHSSITRPMEIYLAESADKLREARPITSFNELFTERDLPQGRPYRWKADDGAEVEGMLLYPPGKFEAKNLPLFVLMHGGPDDADGDHFEADWYQWDRLAASQGWLVFEPNYRGSAGYGDKFLEQIVPEILTRPGKDVLAGVDALLRDGIADPAHLAIGGYSYGGYLTNWLISQTARFKAAVTGAGAVEHVANWGNDDMTFDDAYVLGGPPWEAGQRYQDQAAIFQINKVRTPTHIVGGQDDVRVAVLEQYLLDRALHNLGVPSTLLTFPGEGHSLDKNPWHGKIKVREELQWLSRYGGIGPPQ
jgi:dipeptidyl aminopeptidase/acylaminoacyl peptidase